MALFTKSVFKPRTRRDGVRVLITFPDKKNTDKRINSSMFDIHCKTFGVWFVGKYLRGEISWEEYERKYLEEIRSKEKSCLVEILIYFAKRMNVTLLCLEETDEYCHRRLLAEECKRRCPDLVVIHR